MIDYLRGYVRHIESEYMVIDVHGVGYQVFCANPYSFQRSKDLETTIFIHHHVREDAMLLYGFETRDAQSLFRKLLDVSGIGPRVAMGILSGGSPEALVAAIRGEDYQYLSRLPGVGKKTAARIVLDLKDKLAASFIPSGGAVSNSTGSPGPSLSPVTETWQSAREGLLALGFTDTEIAHAWTAIQNDVSPDASVDALMKAALQQLYKG